MYKPLDAPVDVWAMKVSGEVSLDEVNAMYDVLDTMLKTHKTVGMVLDMTEFSDASRDAINADVKHELSLLGKISQLKRMALLTDKKWISYLIERFDPIIPSMKMKVFPAGETEKAVAWAAAL